MNVDEAASELHPLLKNEDVDATPVYPIIHMIRQVSSNSPDSPDSRNHNLQSLCIKGHDSEPCPTRLQTSDGLP